MSLSDSLVTLVAVALMGLLVFLVFADTYPSDAIFSQKGSPAGEVDRDTESEPLSIGLGSGLAADLGLEGPIWLMSRSSDFTLSNDTIGRIEVRMTLAIGQGVCRTSRVIHILSPSDSQSFQLQSDDMETHKFVFALEPLQSRRFLVEVDGLPCLIESDPRIFYGQLQFQRRDVTTLK